MSAKKEIDESSISSEASGNAQALKELAPTEAVGLQDLGTNMIAIPADSVPVNTPLPCTVYMKKGEKFLVYRRQAEKINYKTALENQKRNTESLYIHKSFWGLFMKSLENLKIAHTATEAEKAVLMRHLLVAYGQELEKQIEEPKKPYFLKMKKHAEDIAHTIIKNPAAGTKLLRHSDDPNLYFVNHSVNVAIYSCLIAIKLGIKASDIPHLTFAALVHDCGNLLVPRRLLYKKEEYTADERAQMQEHPKRGAELLNAMNFSGKVVEAVAHHHERMDGTGYPDKLRDKFIPLFSKIISIADVFDALTMNRPSQKAIPVKEALAKMAEMQGKFDPSLLPLLVNHERTAADVIKANEG